MFQGLGLRVECSGFRIYVWGLGFRVQVFRVEDMRGAGLRVKGKEFSIQGAGFRV